MNETSSSPVAIDDTTKVEIDLLSSLDAEQAELLRQKLLEALAQKKPLTLHGQAVERVSTAFLQVVFAGTQAARSAGTEFNLMKPSAALCAGAADLGFDLKLNTWMEYRG